MKKKNLSWQKIQDIQQQTTTTEVRVIKREFSAKREKEVTESQEN